MITICRKHCKDFCTCYGEPRRFILREAAEEKRKIARDKQSRIREGENIANANQWLRRRRSEYRQAIFAHSIAHGLLYIAYRYMSILFALSCVAFAIANRNPAFLIGTFVLVVAPITAWLHRRHIFANTGDFGTDYCKAFSTLKRAQEEANMASRGC